MVSTLWSKRRGPGWSIGGVAAVAVALIVAIAIYRNRSPSGGPPNSTVASTASHVPHAPPPSAETAGRRSITFERLLVDEIKRERRIFVVVHVALSGPSKRRNAPAGRVDPKSDLRWGAMYGFETYLSRTNGWSRVEGARIDNLHMDNLRVEPTSAGSRVNAKSAAAPESTDHVIDTALLRRTVEPGEAWLARGVDQPFDVYVLGLAYPPEQTLRAMQDCVQLAMGSSRLRPALDSEGLTLDRPPVLVGYMGRNAVAEEPVDLFAGLTVDAMQPTGIFFAASLSAIQLHAACVHHGLYPVLFAREPIVPEAYLIEGILTALESGRLDDGFLDSAATAYARRQKGVSTQRAREILFR